MTFRIRLATGSLACLCLAVLKPNTAEAALPTLTYTYKHHIFTLSARQMTDWQTRKEVWMFRGQEVVPPAELRAEGDRSTRLPEGFAKANRPAWNKTAIINVLNLHISLKINKEAGAVTIKRNGSGSVVFDGAGFPGQSVDVEQAALLTIKALESGIATIQLPVIETPPTVTVLDKELRDQGIKEFVTLGESDFHGSTKNRIHNVTTGLNKFNGHLIEQGEIFSFVKELGPVDASTGYLKELTIIGDKTLPDYGGGLCQVSSTAYRGVWEYGFPIVQRKNHSFAVHYYAPQGTDATVYPPNVDIKFLNDSPGALLMQTVIDVPNVKAYFLYYGTKDDRKSHVYGPYTWNHTPAPAPRTEETTEIPAGTRRKVGEAVPGMNAAWFRVVEKDGQTETKGTYSTYQARPLYWQIGVDHMPTGSGALSDAPAGEAILAD